MKLSPIVLFVFNRPLHTRQTIEALQKNYLAKDSNLFIFSDAPKNPETTVKVLEVREFIRSITGFKAITIIEREHNFGLAASVIDGVSRLCNEHGRVIVLEDDLVTSPHFLEYMNTALDRYEDTRQVMQISGYMFPVDFATTTDAVFLPMTTSWGWATWQRAWQHFDSTSMGYEILKKDSNLRHQFNLGGYYNYFGMLEHQLLGKVDSWAIRWYLSVFMQNGLTLFPVKTLVENKGFDGSGTHGPTGHFVNLLNPDFKVNIYPPSTIVAVTKMAIYEYMKIQYSDYSLGNLIRIIKSKLSEYFKKISFPFRES